MVYTMLVDETGTGGDSEKIIFVGVLVDDSSLSTIEEKIKSFNEGLLKTPGMSNRAHWVNAVDEPRHYVDDHFTLREYFIDRVLENVNCRVYVAMADYHADKLQATKIKLMEELLRLVRSTTRIDDLSVICEESDKPFQKMFPDISFRSKDYLPLCIADYYAAMLHKFHNLRLKLQSGKNVRIEDSSLEIRFYETMHNQIAVEHDISSDEYSSRRNRHFYKQFKKLYT